MLEPPGYARQPGERGGDGEREKNLKIQIAEHAVHVVNRLCILAFLHFSVKYTYST